MREQTFIKHNLTALLVLTLLLCSASVPVAAGSLYKWIDENGQIRYSDRLPASQAKKKHQQLDGRGFVVSTTEDARSEEDLAAEAEAKRLAEEQAKKDAAAKAIQDKKDQVLLLTYSSEEEMNLAHEDRVEVIDSVIRLINKSIASTQEKLDELEARAETNFTSKGRDVPGGLAQKIEHFSRKIENRNAQLQLKQDEKAKINQQHEMDIARLRLLKSEETQNN